VPRICNEIKQEKISHSKQQQTRSEKSKNHLISFMALQNHHHYSALLSLLLYMHGGDAC
jgi:hypothetical protein